MDRDREVLKKLLEKQEIANKDLSAKYQRLELEVYLQQIGHLILSQNQEIRENQDNAQRNKYTLENTLLDQLTNVRSEMEKLQEMNRQLDKKNYSLQNENERLQVPSPNFQSTNSSDPTWN